MTRPASPGALFGQASKEAPPLKINSAMHAYHLLTGERDSRIGHPFESQLDARFTHKKGA